MSQQKRNSKDNCKTSRIAHVRMVAEKEQQRQFVKQSRIAHVENATRRIQYLMQKQWKECLGKLGPRINIRGIPA
jgi:hypothetical protein